MFDFMTAFFPWKKFTFLKFDITWDIGDLVN